MMRRLPHCVLTVSLFCLFDAPPAAADPVTITVTGGSLVGVTGELAPPSTMTGPDFSFTAAALHMSGFTGFLPLNQCGGDGCLPGEMIDLSAVGLSTRHSDDGLANPVLTVNGLRIDDFSGGEVADHTVDLFFSSQSRVAPAFGDFSPVTLTAPFTLDGRVDLFQQSRPGGGGRLFRLNGRGTATLRLRPSAPRDDGEPRAWEAEYVRYDFESPAPVPEPSTMLLVGCGLAALVRSRRRRR
jgi:PEP-CTERM motif